MVCSHMLICFLPFDFPIPKVSGSVNTSKLKFEMQPFESLFILVKIRHCFGLGA